VYIAAGLVTTAGLAAPPCVAACLTAIGAGIYGCTELCGKFASCDDDDCEIGTTQNVLDSSATVGCVDSQSCPVAGTYLREQKCNEVGTWPYYREVWEDTGNYSHSCPVGTTLSYIDSGV
jgi:hypothetical protein